MSESSDTEDMEMLDGLDDLSSLDDELEGEDAVLKERAASSPKKRKGRPRAGVNEKRLTEVLRLYFLEKMSMRQVADIVGVSHMSVYRMLSDPNLELLI